MKKLLTITIASAIFFSCEPKKPSDAHGNPIMAKFVKDEYGNIYRLDMCECGRNSTVTCLVPVDTFEYKVRVFED